MGLRRSLAERLRADFLAGLGIVLPAGLTVMLALWAVDFVDDKALPFLPGWFGEGHVAGLGLLAFLALTTLAGALLKGVAGRGVVRVSEALVAQIPLARSVHLGTKQIVQTAIDKGNSSFRQVCLLEYPSRGRWEPVVLAAPVEGEILRRSGAPDLVAVLVSRTPVPVFGFLIFVPRRDLFPVDMTLEEAAKLVMTGGLVGPPGTAVETATDTMPSPRP